MKKSLFGLFIFFGSLNTFAQTENTETTLFAQCLIEMNSVEEMRALETEMRLNPYVKVARLDYSTQRAFILTKNLDELSETNFTSWFNEYSAKVRCIQIGRHGVDKVNPYPFEGCTQ